MDRKIFHSNDLALLWKITNKNTLYTTIKRHVQNGVVLRIYKRLDPQDYFGKLIAFIKGHVNQTTINEDLNTLLPNHQFQQVRKILLPETLSLLEREQKKLSGK